MILIIPKVFPNMDISAALLILNTLLIGVVGYFLRDFMDKTASTRAMAIQNQREIELMKASYAKDIVILTKAIDGLNESFKNLDERLRKKDQELIQELKEAIKQNHS